MSSQGESLTGVNPGFEGPKLTEKCGTSLEMREEDANMCVIQMLTRSNISWTGLQNIKQRSFFGTLPLN